MMNPCPLTPSWKEKNLSFRTRHAVHGEIRNPEIWKNTDPAVMTECEKVSLGVDCLPGNKVHY
jgi:hypothetical protein